MTGAHTTPKGHGDGPGTPGDLLAAFTTQAVAWTAPPAPDRAVAAAVSLGWRLGEALTWAQAAARHDDATIARLGHRDAGLAPSARWSVLVGQIGAGQKGLGAADAGTLTAGPPPATDAEAVGRLRDEVLEALYVADDVRGKGFRLGYELQQGCAGGWTATGMRSDAAQVQVLLVALATKLPANAAHSVRNSIILWEEQLAAGEARHEAKLGDTLARQGELWRGMLAGEVAPTDLLRVSDYVGTAEEVIGRIRELLLRTAQGRLRLLAIAVLLLVLVGLVVLVIWGDSAGGVTAGAGSLIAAFGLTWKGIGTLFGRAAAKAEQALWDAEIDWTIAYRATLSTTQPGGPAATRAEHRQAHLATWLRWKQKWPDLDVIDDRPVGRSAKDVQPATSQREPSS